MELTQLSLTQSSAIQHLLQAKDESNFFLLLSSLLEKDYFADWSANIEIMKVYKDDSSKVIVRHGQLVTNAPIVPQRDSVAGYVAKMKRPYFSNNVERDPLFMLMKSQRTGIKSELVFPLTWADQVVASIHFMVPREEKKLFAEQDFIRVRETLNHFHSAFENIYQYLLAEQINHSIVSKMSQQLVEKELPKSPAFEKSVLAEVEGPWSRFIGQSPKMLEIKKLAQRVSMQDLPISIVGELGTGKRTLARLIHENGPRKEGNFAILECATSDEQTLTQELFGTYQRPGLLEFCQGGTLCLSDISELSASLQSKLHQLMTTGMMYRQTERSSKEKMMLNVRLIATSKQSLEEAVAQGKLKQDLFYRFSSVSMSIPALTQRSEDMPLLADAFINQGSFGEKRYMTNTALEQLKQHQYSANILELRTLLERACMLNDGQYIEQIDIMPLHQPVALSASSVSRAIGGSKTSGIIGHGNDWRQPAQGAGDAQLSEASLADLFTKVGGEISLFEVEKTYILHLLEKSHGNKTKAAKALGITVKTLYNKLHSYGVFQSDKAVDDVEV